MPNSTETAPAVVNHFTPLTTLSGRHRETLETWAAAHGPHYSNWLAACNSRPGGQWGTRAVLGLFDGTLELSALITFAEFPGLNQKPSPRKQGPQPNITVELLNPQLVDLAWIMRRINFEAFLFGPRTWVHCVPEELGAFCAGEPNVRYIGESPRDVHNFEFTSVTPPAGLPHFTGFGCNIENPPWGLRRIVMMTRTYKGLAAETVAVMTMAPFAGSTPDRIVTFDTQRPRLVTEGFSEYAMTKALWDTSATCLAGNWAVRVPPAIAKFVRGRGLPSLGIGTNGMEVFGIQPAD